MGRKSTYRGLAADPALSEVILALGRESVQKLQKIFGIDDMAAVVEMGIGIVDEMVLSHFGPFHMLSEDGMMKQLSEPLLITVSGHVGLLSFRYDDDPELCTMV